MSYVYFARGKKTNLIKIGKSIHPKKRVVNFKSAWDQGEEAKLIFTIPGDLALEREFHIRFKAHRHHGEWFHERGDLAAFVKERGKSYKKQHRQPASKKSKPQLPTLHILHSCEPVPRNMGYARVSTAEQSLDMQITALRNAGVQDNDLFCDKLSAVSAHRPQFHLLRKQMQRGDTLFFYSYSRISRDLKQLLTFVDEMRDEGITLRSISEPHIDPYTTNGRLLISVTGAVDENERGRVRARTRDGMAELKRQGMMLGRPVLVTDEVKEKARIMRRKNVPVSTIAIRLGISKSAVYGAL